MLSLASRVFLAVMVVALALFAMPRMSLAQEDVEAHRALGAIYARRADLQSLFRASDWTAIRSAKTSGLTDLETWARTYGYKEHPELAYFNPNKPVAAPIVVAPVVTSTTPLVLDAAIPSMPLRVVQTVPGTFDTSKVSADKFLVIDPATKQVLLAQKPDEPHPLASITKLMTALIISTKGLSMDRIETVLADDEVGGARLRVNNGTPLTIRDIFYAMIVGSANNAAHALARITGQPMTDFIAEMNAKAKALGLSSTAFADTSGLDLANVSTARDIATLALNAFDNEEIKRAATTAYYPLVAEGKTRQMKNTNGLLTDPNNGLYVLGGKTGYLVESKWNLVVEMKDKREKPLLIVMLGSATEPALFKDSQQVAKWVWDHYEWVK